MSAFDRRPTPHPGPRAEHSPPILVMRSSCAATGRLSVGRPRASLARHAGAHPLHGSGQKRRGVCWTDPPNSPWDAPTGPGPPHRARSPPRGRELPAFRYRLAGPLDKSGAKRIVRQSHKGPRPSRSPSRVRRDPPTPRPRFVNEAPRARRKTGSPEPLALAWQDACAKTDPPPRGMFEPVRRRLLSGPPTHLVARPPRATPRPPSEHESGPTRPGPPPIRPTKKLIGPPWPVLRVAACRPNLPKHEPGLYWASSSGRGRSPLRARACPRSSDPRVRAFLGQSHPPNLKQEPDLVATSTRTHNQPHHPPTGSEWLDGPFPPPKADRADDRPIR